MKRLSKTNKNRCYHVTDKGKVRPNNEDFCLCHNEAKLYLLSDGMGGHNAGEIASSETVKYLSNILLNEINESPKDMGDFLEQSILNTHEHIFELSRKKPEYRGMGCTISIAYIDNNFNLHTIHVGDSRVYLIRNRSIQQIGMDHSLIAKAIKNGQMTPEQAKESNIKNQLTMAIGVNVDIIPEYNMNKIKLGDKIILCSDGLWDMVSDEIILEIVNSKENSKEICTSLLNKALNEGGKDNISIISILI